MIRRIKASLICCTALLTLAACNPQPTPTIVYTQPSINTSKTMEAGRTDMSYKGTFTALMIPARSQNLTFKSVSGNILKKNVYLYDRVQKGDVLAELDTADIEAQIEKSLIQGEIWELQLKLATETEKSHRLNVEQANLVMQEAKKAYDDDYVEARRLVYERARNSYNQAVNNQSIFATNRKIQDINYKEYLDNHAKLEENLENCQLVAPANGVITQEDTTEEGEYINYTRGLYKFAAWTDMVLKFSSSHANNLIGQSDITLTIQGESYSAYSYTPVPGEEIFSLNDVGSRSLAYLSFRSNVPDVNPNTQVTVGVSIEKKDALYISSRALKNINGAIVVYRKAGDTFEEVPVECGIEDGGNVEILSGLSEGDIVALD